MPCAKHIVIEDWPEFEAALRQGLASLGHRDSMVVARNFQTTTYSDTLGDVDRLALVLATGTDRDSTSDFWNEPGFDHRQDKEPTGKRADEIIYAFIVDLAHEPYLVRHAAEPQEMDITEGLSQYDGMIIYDSAKLLRQSKNEYWFRTSPCDAALLVFSLASDDDAEDKTESGNPAEPRTATGRER